MQQPFLSMDLVLKFTDSSLLIRYEVTIDGKSVGEQFYTAGATER